MGEGQTETWREAKKQRQGEGARHPPAGPSLNLSSAGSQIPGQMPQVSLFPKKLF